MQDPHTLREGVHVEVRGETWRLAGITHYGRCTRVTLVGIGPGNSDETCELVAPFDRPRPSRSAVRWRPSNRAAAARAAARLVASAYPDAGLAAAAAARIDLLPWQLAPALAVVSGHPRVLLADEVGLGKTVQAGLVAAELTARNEATRVLVLTPAGLRAQWVHELDARFGLKATLVDQAHLSRDRARLPQGVNPWHLNPLIVTSIDLVRQTEVLAALDTCPLDLLIVDEAHHAAPGTDRGRAVARLASQALRVVLLTATPHAGDPAAYRMLSTLGDLGGSAPTLVFRRTHASTGAGLPRRSHVLRLRPSPAERRLFRCLARYLDWLCAHGGGAARLLASVLARRAASSPDALARTIARRRALLHETVLPPSQPPLPWDEPDTGDDEVSDALSGLRIGVDDARERAWLAGIDMLARAAGGGGGSKIRVLERLLARIREPVIVFTEYRDTLDMLRAHFHPIGQVAMLHGGMNRLERESAVAAFVEGPAAWLLATDAGSEGLNLHARCRVAVNLEAPPSPTRQAQRAGRLVRLGQSHTVHLFTLVYRGGPEGTALAGLAAQQASIEAALSRTGTSQSALLRGLEEAAGREARRLARMRRLMAVAAQDRPRDPRPSAPCGLRVRNGSGRRWLLTLTSRAHDESGRLVDTVTVGVDVRWHGAPPRAWHAVRDALGEIIAASGLDAVLASRAAALQPERARARAPLVIRARQLHAQALAPAPRYQPALFDGRADARAAYAATRQHEAARWWQGHLSRLEAASGTVRFEPPVLGAAFACRLVEAHTRGAGAR